MRHSLPVFQRLGSLYFARLLALACLSATLSQVARADTDVEALRAEFRRAYAAAEADSGPIGDTAALLTYPLYPYLQQLRIQRALVAERSLTDTDRAAEEFLTVQGTAVAARDLRRVWYASLAKRQQWERYLANYREVDDATLRCHALTARLALQRLDGLKDAALALWNTAADSLPACEPAFTWLKTQNALTPELIDRRARLALREGNPAFARQIAAMAPAEVAAPLFVWAVLIERPPSAIDAAINQRTKAIEADALLDGWSRLVRRDYQAGIQRYAKLVRERNLDSASASRYALELALALAWSRRPEALEYFARVDASVFDDRAFEWHARAALWAGDWQLTERAIAAMPDSLRKQTRWKYWSARAAELQGRAAVARPQYSALLTDDNYYAALAAARLGTRYAPQQQSLEFDDAQIHALTQEPALIRARELLFMPSPTLRANAYEEWRTVYTKLSAPARRQSVALAARWKWYDQVVTLAAQQGSFNDYTLFYPQPFDADVQAAAQATSLPPSLIYATLRQESLYRTDALSVAGAKGVMQLLPETAQRIARRWKLKNGDLFDPAVNIPIGAAKIRDMIDRFGQTALALGAYNAGPNTVPRWLPAQPKESDVWIENIPYNETRTYIQRIYWHSLVFDWLATKEPQDPKPWLTRIEPATR